MKKNKKKVVYSAEGFKFFMAENPPKELRDSTWYCWVVPTSERPNFWNEEGHKDFMLDGKAHLSTRGDATRASFCDSPEPWRMWDWSGDIKYFRECIPFFEKGRGR